MSAESVPRRECRTCGEPIDNIIELVQHGCDRVLGIDSLSDSEKSTLMYIESQIVDNGGELEPVKMNHEDRQNIKVFKASGLLQIDESGGDMVIDRRNGNYYTDLVTKFTDEAWKLAMKCRKERGMNGLDHEADLGTPPGDNDEV